MVYIWEVEKWRYLWWGQSAYVNVLHIIFSERTVLKEVRRKNLLTEAAQIRGILLKHKHLRKWKNTKINARSEKQIFSGREQNIPYNNKKRHHNRKGRKHKHL